MKEKSPDKKSIGDILGFLDSEKVQTSVKLPTQLVAEIGDAAEILDLFICDLHEAALKKLLEELRPLIEAKKQEQKNGKTKTFSKPRKSLARKTPKVRAHAS